MIFQFLLSMSMLWTAESGYSNKSPGVNTLGVVDYMNGESSLVSFRGKLVLMDSVAWCYPWHIRFDNASKSETCVSYIRVRDMATGAVISNISQSCQHTFGAAFVYNDTIYIYATRCARYQTPHAWCELPQQKQPCACWHGGSAPVSDCAVDVFWSTDLVIWETKAAFFPGHLLPNVDVTAVQGRSDMNFLMIMEGGGLVATNASTPTEGWKVISEHGPHVGCPSIKQVNGYFYVVGGGVGVVGYRSRDLVNWSPAASKVMACGNPNQDRHTVSHPGLFSWRPMPSAMTENVSMMITNNTRNWDKDASDLDLVEWNSPLGTQTLLVFICGNQHSDGFGMIAAFNGSLEQYFNSLFP
eukprot:m.57877 g.57877  ORF g.57877 m.57877 type:complete len:356 (-) comp11139_c0_seq1:69-1136(-)